MPGDRPTSEIERFKEAALSCPLPPAVELIGETPFPLIGELPYFVTLGPHSFYWFRLVRPEA